MPATLAFETALGLAALLLAATSAAQPDLPDAEKPLADTVDAWGLPFSDQLVRYRGHFANAPEAPFAMGLSHELVKVWPTKYWFRGETIAAGVPALRSRERWAAVGQTQAFQVVALPRIGAPEATYTLTVSAPGATVEISREVFVQTAGAAYPRLASGRWPDPLLPESTVTVGGTDCGVFWVDVTSPGEGRTGAIECAVSLTDGRATAVATVPIYFVSAPQVDPKANPFVTWSWQHELTDAQFQDLCALMLRHHVQPIDALKGRWDPADPERFDTLHDFLAARGQRIFEVDRPGDDDPKFDALYAHLKQREWLANTWVYSIDEPDEETFRTQNIPFRQKLAAKYPGLKTYFASDWHAGMEQAADAWMTDISASGYDPGLHRGPGEPQLWHYYCHLPIHWQERAPLVQAPNMQIDNPALEHRLALWMSHYYGAKVVFIWAGNAYTFADDFWQTLTLTDKPSPFPYAGIHNGNGWVVYPSPGGQGTLPSLRLKVIRDGLQDIALMEGARAAVQAGAITGERAALLAELLDPVPGVFVHTHYFDQLPETLLARREAILRAASE
jgi:hypothetical protein